MLLNRVSRIVFVSAFLLMWLATAKGMVANPVRPEQINQIFADFESTNAPGAAALVLDNGRTVFGRGYGVTDLRTLRKIDPHTNFRLASCTKQFTAMATMLLVHDGKLHYQDPLTELCADFPEYGQTITIRNLLNHTSGLQDYEDLMPKPAATGEENLSQIKDAGVLALLKQQTTAKFPAGTRWDYSNSGYAVLAMIVEKVSRQPFGEFLHDRIFAPLKMTQTVAYEKGRNEVSNRAYGHSYGQGVWRETDQSSTSAVL